MIAEHRCYTLRISIDSRFVFMTDESYFALRRALLSPARAGPARS